MGAVEKTKLESTTNGSTQRERRGLKRRSRGRETDLEDANTKQEKAKGTFKSERERERERERESSGTARERSLGGNNESPLPPTKPAMSRPRLHPLPLPPLLSVAAPFMLSPRECLNSLLLFNSLGGSRGHRTAHHPATLPPANIQHAHPRT